jgi:hypothetical protein
MYACIPEIGGGFFEGGVRTQRCNRPSLRPTPYPRNSWIASGRHSLASHRSEFMQNRTDGSTGTPLLRASLKTLLPLALGVALMVPTGTCGGLAT